MNNEKNQQESKLNSKKGIFFAIITGVVSGFINGLFGGGGGMIVVPMLVYLLKHKPKIAHATAILIILPLSIISGILYIAFGNFEWQIGLPVGVGVIVGGVAGAFLLKKLSAKWVTIIFSILMAFAGGKLLFF